MNRRPSYLRVLLSLGLSFAFDPVVPSAWAGEPNVTGTWKSPFTTPMGSTLEFTFEFKQDGERLIGIFTDPGGSSTDISDGQIKNGKIRFSFVRERNGRTFVSRYQGTPTGDTIKGTSTVEANGASRETDWEARRVSAAFRPRTAWTIADLASAVEPLDRGRSFDNGKQMFQVANCITCHRMEGVGNEFGPDLTKLDPKMTAAELLRNILEPSATINEKYQAHVFETASGKVISGLVLEESPERIKIIENPLGKAVPVELRPSEVINRTKSPSSIMPKGLLERLTREEILDLVAYVVSRGNPDHPVFQSTHDQGEAAGRPGGA